MQIQVLVILMFVAVAAAVVGIYMLMTGRNQVRREKTIENRLQEAAGGAVPATEEAAAGGSTLLLKEIVGPLPNMDRVANAALKGSGVERWLQQTGTAMTISAVILFKSGRHESTGSKSISRKRSIFCRAPSAPATRSAPA